MQNPRLKTKISLDEIYKNHDVIIEQHKKNESNVRYVFALVVSNVLHSFCFDR